MSFFKIKPENPINNGSVQVAASVVYDRSLPSESLPSVNLDNRFDDPNYYGASITEVVLSGTGSASGSLVDYNISGRYDYYVSVPLSNFSSFLNNLGTATGGYTNRIKGFLLEFGYGIDTTGAWKTAADAGKASGYEVVPCLMFNSHIRSGQTSSSFINVYNQDLQNSGIFNTTRYRSEWDARVPIFNFLYSQITQTGISGVMLNLMCPGFDYPVPNIVPFSDSFNFVNGLYDLSELNGEGHYQQWYQYMASGINNFILAASGKHVLPYPSTLMSPMWIYIWDKCQRSYVDYGSLQSYKGTYYNAEEMGYTKNVLADMRFAYYPMFNEGILRNDKYEFASGLVASGINKFFVNLRRNKDWKDFGKASWFNTRGDY